MKSFKNFALILLLCFAINSVYSQTTPRISIQGTLLDARGAAVADGEHAVQFRLYEMPEGGTPIWTEDAIIESGDGIYSHYLGSINPLDDSYFEQTLFVALQIGPFELPRTELNYAPYTFTSNSAFSAGKVICSGAVGDVKFSILNPGQFANENGDCWVPMNGANIFGSELASFMGISTLPNASGLFIRAHEYNDGQDPDRTPSSAIATIQNDAYGSHTHTGTTNSAGSHSHSYMFKTSSAASNSKSYLLKNDVDTPTSKNTGVAGSHSHTLTLDNAGGGETRPKNLNLYAYIRIN